jgi:hypothetical protein
VVHGSAVPDPMTTRTWPSERAASAVWAALSLALFCASSLGVFAINTVMRLFTDVPHLFEMAEWSVVWGALAVVGVLAAGRLAFGRWLPVSMTALTVAASGTVLSAVFHVVLQQWALTRFGEMDADLIGWTAGLFAVLLGISTSAFGVLVAPRGSAAWPLAFVLTGSAMTAFIVLANVPGLGDGIDPESWPLAIWLGLSGLYGAVVSLIAVMRAREHQIIPSGIGPPTDHS